MGWARPILHKWKRIGPLGKTGLGPERLESRSLHCRFRSPLLLLLRTVERRSSRDSRGSKLLGYQLQETGDRGGGKMVRLATGIAMCVGSFLFMSMMDRVHVWIALHQDEKVRHPSLVSPFRLILLQLRLLQLHILFHLYISRVPGDLILFGF